MSLKHYPITSELVQKASTGFTMAMTTEDDAAHASSAAAANLKGAHLAPMVQHSCRRVHLSSWTVDPRGQVKPGATCPSTAEAVASAAKRRTGHAPAALSHAPAPPLESRVQPRGSFRSGSSRECRVAPAQTALYSPCEAVAAGARRTPTSEARRCFVATASHILVYRRQCPLGAVVEVAAWAYMCRHSSRSFTSPRDSYLAYT
ncbi:hypothetical protein HETIRDRAFT_391723, partial [Heterobasidion irregulare TC 32-1]